MTHSVLSFVVESTDFQQGLDFTAELDNTELINLHVTTPTTVRYYLDNSKDLHHVLKLTMSGKTSAHTQINDQGEIIQDLMLRVHSIKFDNICVDSIINNHARYHHNNNGHTDWIQQSFHNHMGCNGTVEFPFYTPIYVWLLENI